MLSAFAALKAEEYKESPVQLHKDDSSEYGDAGVPQLAPL